MATYTRTGSASTASSSYTQTRTRRTLDVTKRTETIAGGRRTWSRFARRVRRARRFLARALTPTGWFATAALVVAIPLAFTVGWVEAGAIAAVCAVALVIAVIFVLGRREYHVDLAMLRDRAVVGDEASGGVTVTNVGRRTALPSRVEIPMGDALAVVDVPLLRPGASFSDHLALPTERRAIVPVGPVRAVRADPLSLLRIETVWPGKHTLYVHPRTTAVPASNAGLIRDLEGNPTRTIADADISFHALREYAPGDSMRHIHWKATARMGTLMVRQFEETRRSRIAIFLSLREDEYRDAEEFELAVSIAGSIGVAARRSGREVQVSVSEPLSEFSVRGIRTVRTLSTATARTLLDSLSGVDAFASAPRLQEASEIVAQESPGLSVAFLITGSVPTLTHFKSAALKFPANVAVVAVIADLEGAPRIAVAHDFRVVSVPVLDDLRHLMLRGDKS